VSSANHGHSDDFLYMISYNTPDGAPDGNLITAFEDDLLVALCGHLTHISHNLTCLMCLKLENVDKICAEVARTTELADDLAFLRDLKIGGYSD
jgi:hypothetical protein